MRGVVGEEGWWWWLVVVDGGEGRGWVANKINELALVEGNLPSSLVMVLLCSLMHARQR